MGTKPTNPEARTTGRPPQHLPDEIASADASLREAAKQLGAAVAELRSSEDKAWKEYSDDVHEALLHMNAQLEVATAQVKAAHSETREDLVDALHQAASVRYGIIDQLRVQTHLGLMEARERSHDAMDDLNQVGRRLEAVIESVRNDTRKTWSDLFHDTTATISHLRTAVQALAG